MKALPLENRTAVLNPAVKRNKDRFPEDFMFRLTKTEKDELVTKEEADWLLKQHEHCACSRMRLKPRRGKAR